MTTENNMTPTTIIPTTENNSRMIIAKIIDREIRKATSLFRPPGDCMNTNKEENKRLRRKITKNADEETEEV